MSKDIKKVLESRVYNQYRSYGGYLDVRITNLKIRGDEYSYTKVLKFENYTERHHDCRILKKDL